MRVENYARFAEESKGSGVENTDQKKALFDFRPLFFRRSSFLVAKYDRAEYYPSMTSHVDLQHLQSNLPRLLNQVAAGDTLLICKDEKPIAEIRPIEKPRPLGLAKGEVTFLAGFDDPLPPDVIEAFEGKAE